MGETWTDSSTTLPHQGWESIAYSSTRGFVAVGTSNQRVMTSPDGLVWTSQTPMDENYWTSVTYSESLDIFVAVAPDYIAANGNRIAYSTDGGINWIGVSAQNLNLRDVAWIEQLKLFVATCVNGNTLLSSSDGITWTQISHPENREYYAISAL